MYGGGARLGPECALPSKTAGHLCRNNANILTICLIRELNRIVWRINYTAGYYTPLLLTTFHIKIPWPRGRSQEYPFDSFRHFSNDTNNPPMWPLNDPDSNYVKQLLAFSIFPGKFLDMASISSFYALHHVNGWPLALCSSPAGHTDKGRKRTSATKNDEIEQAHRDGQSRQR